MSVLLRMEKEAQVNILWKNSTSTLPSVEELIPITQSLISPELAIAFRIRSEEEEAHQNSELHVSPLHPRPNYFHTADPTNPGALVGKKEGMIISEENYQRQSRVLIPPFHHVQRLHQQQGVELFSSQIEANLQKTWSSTHPTSRSIPSGKVLFGSIADGTSPYGRDHLQRKNVADRAKISHERAEEEEEEEEDMSSRRGGEKAMQEAEVGIGMDMEESMEVGESTAAESTCGEELMQGAARTLKRPRLVWTPQLHKRFVDAVAHLGIKNAVPKTIMQLMNVEGLTRENVASHLQKYRLYLKRVQGVMICNDGSSSSDHPLFASAISPPPPHHFFSHSTNESALIQPVSPALDRPVAGLKQSAPRGSSPQIGGLNQAAHNMARARARAVAHHSTSSTHAVMYEVVQHEENRGCTSSQGILTLFPMTSR